jgi:hypothetical protein
MRDCAALALSTSLSGLQWPTDTSKTETNDQKANRLQPAALRIKRLNMSSAPVEVYDYKAPNGNNPAWIWQGTPKHIAEMGLHPISGTAKQVPATEIDETGRYRPEWGTGQQ